MPYTLLGTAAVYLLTGNTTKALAVLMVDFSCALKLAMPIAVLSAIREGISSMVDGRKVIIGSYHFVFEDEGCSVPEEYQETFEHLPEEYSHLYLAIEGTLAAVICIDDPLREEAAGVVAALKA